MRTATRQALRRSVPVSLRQRLSSLPPWGIAVCVGPSPLELHESGQAQPVLDGQRLGELGLAAAADPFAVHRDGTWSLFFEAVPIGSRTGRIDVMTSTDLVHWEHHGPALRERSHLSYPCPVEDDGSVAIVPESSGMDSVRLYRTAPGGHDLVLDCVLLTGRAFKDSTVFRHDDRWWMYSETSRRHTNDELRLYHAEELAGPWREHPRSPVVRGDARVARPAGYPVVVDGRLLRFAQDSSHDYGARVLALEVTTLTTTDYAERLLATPVLPLPPSPQWRATAMHHLDAHRIDGSWISFVDGHA